MITIVDYQAGNLRSVLRACRAAGQEATLSADPDAIRRADKVIFPGVGHAGSAMANLVQTGMDEALRDAFQRGTPLLGICVGAQLILERSEESPLPCLGLLPGIARRFRPEDPQLKIPHMGWNAVHVCRPHSLLSGLQPGDELYFVHSYYPAPTDPACVAAESEHGERFCCALGRDNLFATQFHPEKSGRLGLGILERFGHWKGE